ncbi:nucleoside hydrolase [Alloscardovia macacae]|uniref:Nucleoside hydrolase n=1 Tax=Alloscardovia macacae TaxID=1160091 RepID=A0A1Y2SVV4_9BIFI|nr:nucleoside hydrolase [Alloscardovia macacae]OTA27440.1 nucleoside hydrolase [Alloscardovia macacae]OTA29451.1 nucleoside hydrolase [Alloscardovia macacae]
MTHRIILDCDTGIDDTLALLYLFGSDDVELLGVVGTFGNVTEEQATRNNRVLLDAAGLSHVPAYRGVPVPSFWTAEQGLDYEVDEGCERFHGKNGWGGAELELPESVKRGEILPDGVEFEAQMVREYGTDVTVIATGPLTNIDALITRYPELASRLHLVIMGGALTQPGNCYNLISETNMVNDPEAANRVFHSGADVTVVGIDVTHRTLMTRAHVESLKEEGAAGCFLAQALSYYVNANEQADPIFLKGSPLHDPLAVGAALNPSLIQCFPINLMVDLTGPQRGRTVGDPALLNEPADHVRMALTVDAPRFVGEWEKRVHAGCRRINAQLDR